MPINSHVGLTPVAQPAEHALAVSRHALADLALLIARVESVLRGAR